VNDRQFSQLIRHVRIGIAVLAFQGGIMVALHGSICHNLGPRRMTIGDN
jgi:hypothetical protein